MQLITRDFIGGLATTAIGSVYLVFASQLRSSTLDDTVGPDGMPRAYGWIMICLGILLSGNAFLSQFRRVHRETNAKREQVKANERVGIKILRAGGLLAFGIAYVLLVDTLGYPLAIALLLTGVILYMGEKPGYKIVLVSVCGAAMLWLIFAQLLGVSMPLGVLKQ